MIKILALTATLLTPVQFFTMPYQPGQPLPRTIQIMDGDIKIGTATVTGNRAVIRDAHNELVGTVEITKQGVAFYDPDGKPVPIGERDKYILGLKDKLQ